MKLYCSSRSVGFAFLLLLVISTGCGGPKLAPVSGIVTAGGDPVNGVKVVFYPKPTDDNPVPGPYASGVTDSQGKFTLVSRGGRNGACLGINQVGFQLLGASKSELQGAQSALRLLKGNPRDNKDSIAEIENKIKEIKNIQTQFSMIDPGYISGRKIEVEIPSGGLENCELDVSKK
jgi:hypothetical protein